MKTPPPSKLCSPNGSRPGRQRLPAFRSLNDGMALAGSPNKPGSWPASACTSRGQINGKRVSAGTGCLGQFTRPKIMLRRKTCVLAFIRVSGMERGKGGFGS